MAKFVDREENILKNDSSSSVSHSDDFEASPPHVSTFYDEEEEEIRKKVLSEVLSPKDGEKKTSTSKTVVYLERMKSALSRAKKLAARAFQDDLIERLPRVVENEPLFHAGTYVDAAARIYSYRVDATHIEAQDIRSKLGDSKLKYKTQENICDDGKSKENESDNDVENCNKKEKPRKSWVHSSDEELLENDYQQLQIDPDDNEDEIDVSVNSDESDNDNCLEELASTKEMVDKLIKKADKAHDKYIRKRCKASFIAVNPADLDDHESIVEFCGHLYCKATYKFDEGSSNGLLMQNALTSYDGRRYMLHNDSRCSTYSQFDKTDGNDLHIFYELLQNAERNTPVSITSTGAFDTTMLTSDFSKICPNNEITMNLTTLPKSEQIDDIYGKMKTLVKNTSFGFDNNRLFSCRRDLQRQLNMNTKKFIALILNSTPEMSPTLRDIFISHLLSPKKSSTSNSLVIPGENGILSAILSDELELFEKSHNWIVFKQRWEKMKNTVRAEFLKKLFGEHPIYNFFFANEFASSSFEDRTRFPVIDPDFWLSKGEIHKAFSKEDNEISLASVLGKFRLSANNGLFAHKGDDFSRYIARIQFVVPKMLTLEKNANDNSQIDEQGGKRIVTNGDEDYADIELDYDAGTNAAVDSDIDIQENVSLENIKADNVQKEIDSSLPVAEEGDPKTAVGDLNFLMKQSILNIASSLINDDTHWKKNLENLNTNSGKRKINEKSTKKEKKMKMSTEISFTLINEADIKLVENRFRQAKRPKMLLIPDSVLYKNRPVPLLCDYSEMDQMFSRFSHVFNERDSHVSDGKSEARISSYMLGNRRNDDSNIRINAFFNAFKIYFDDTSDEIINSKDTSNEVAEAMDFELDSFHSNDEISKDEYSVDSDASSVEEAEIFGVKYAIRQRRINVPAVKRAIGSVLCNSEGELDDRIQEIRTSDASFGKVVVNGEHTFSSLLSKLPNFVTGRTAEDLNAANVFSVLLHMCNENEIELIRANSNCNSISMDLGDFQILSARHKKRKNFLN